MRSHEPTVHHARGNSNDPCREITDSAQNTPERGYRLGSILQQNREEMFRRFHVSGTRPTTLAKAFETKEDEVIRILNEQIRELLRRAKGEA